MVSWLHCFQACDEAETQTSESKRVWGHTAHLIAVGGEEERRGGEGEGGEGRGGEERRANH